jgi:hypothetical protein
MKPGTLVIVEWDDHAFHFGDFDPKLGTVIQETVGFYVDETEGFVRLAMSRRNENTWSDVLVIDRRMLRTLKKVRKA